MSQLEPEEHISFHQADALHLPHEDNTFDIVACQFGVMFFPDKIAGYKQAHRILKPSGKFIFNVWETIDKNDFADVATMAVGEFFPDDPPLFLARTPHEYCDRQVISDELTQAGFSSITITE